MITPIYSISPKNRNKVFVGSWNLLDREAVFYITPGRIFNQGDCVGIDEKLVKRKWFSWCDKIIFSMPDKEIYKIKKSDFLANCWLYPPRADEKLKAPPSTFIPKLMINLDILKKLSGENRQEEKEEMLRIAIT